ncbi:MAG: SHOCT domain-containing protein [Candidatus Sericytochromatia bacterium]|nr:SHOCT domain-containing protein [Candidatus Sericytochromatia bacterium]
MDDKLFDFFKSFDPNVLKKLDGLNITKILKQLEQLKLSGLFDRLEDLNKLTKLLKQMDDIKLSELLKKVEEIKLSDLVKKLENNDLPKLLESFPNNLKSLKYDNNSNPIIRIENRSDSIPDQIKKLAELKDMGIITKEELDAKKKQLLDRM